MLNGKIVLVGIYINRLLKSINCSTACGARVMGGGGGGLWHDISYIGKIFS